MAFEKGHAAYPGSGRPPGSPNKRTGDFRKAQGELYELFEAELHRDTEKEPPVKQTNIQAIVADIVKRAKLGEQFFMQIMLDRWAGKAIIVAEEKAEAPAVSMVFDAPRPERGNGHSAIQ